MRARERQHLSFLGLLVPTLKEAVSVVTVSLASPEHTCAQCWAPEQRLYKAEFLPGGELNSWWAQAGGISSL